LTLVVLDGAMPLEDGDLEILSELQGSKTLTVSNKADLDPAWTDPALLRVSARTGSGIAELRRAIVVALDIEPLRDTPEITNVRHIALVQQAQDALLRACAAARRDEGSLSEEFVLADLQEARVALEAIAGRRADDDVLSHIFSTFCVGK
jgi:tRNA modification GTPase